MAKRGNISSGVNVSLSVFDRVATEISAIDVKSIAAPAGPSRTPADKVVGQCDDGLRQLFELHRRSAEEAQRCIRAVNLATDRMQEWFVSSAEAPTSGRALEKLFAPSDDRDLLIAEIRELEAKAFKMKSFTEFLGALFWAEVKNRYSDAAGEPRIILCNDWVIVVGADDMSSLEDILGHGGPLGDGMMSGFGREGYA